MTDRLTTQLNDGQLERLREMAGGTRRVGAFLSQVTQLLWENREKLEAAPLSDFCLMPKELDWQVDLAEMKRLREETAALMAYTQSKLEKQAEVLAKMELVEARVNRGLEEWNAKIDKAYDEASPVAETADVVSLPT